MNEYTFLFLGETDIVGIFCFSEGTLQVHFNGTPTFVTHPPVKGNAECKVRTAMTGMWKSGAILDTKHLCNTDVLGSLMC